MKTILGISCYYHDSAAAIVVDGEVIAAAQEERFTRIKHTEEFPSHAVEFCFKQAKIQAKDIDAVVFYDKPLLKFERLLQSHYATAPKSWFAFLKAMPIWLEQKLFIKRNIRKSITAIDDSYSKTTPLLFTTHHQSHAASAFYPSPFESAAVLTIDGVGEWETATISHGKANKITPLKSQNFPHSVGLLYSAFTQFLGFKVNSGEYKVMGLAPYGESDSEQTRHFIELIKNEIVHIEQDGAIQLNNHYFNFIGGLSMIRHNRWEKLFQLAPRKPEEELSQAYKNMALAIQKVTEEIVLKMARTAQNFTGERNLCLAGGVALNCVANSILKDAKIFDKIFVQPAAGDAGGAIGAALATYHEYDQKPRKLNTNPIALVELGPSISDESIKALKTQFNANFKELTLNEITRHTAEFLSNGKVVGWCQDRMEFGPRALGFRSILADPRPKDMQQTLNLKIKFRESFRPFAPAVLEEHVKDWFIWEGPAPHMTFTAQAQPDKADSIPSVVHQDGSCRIQTVNQQNHPKFHQLLKDFQIKTGCPVLINTSFNVRGEPIVCTAEDAYRCFMATHMDVLVINNFIFVKEDQPHANDLTHWQRAFKAD